MAVEGKKTKVAALSVVSNTVLIALKVVAGILSGSVSMISEAIHSSVDLLAALIAFFSIRMAAKPADKSHPYGHGKIENVSGVIEGVLILVAAVFIIKEGITKITHREPVTQTTLAIVVMLISAGVNAVISRILYKTAKAEDSIALEADALHLKTDVYTSLGVGLGLLLLKITGISILDPVFAILVALLIIKESLSLVKNAFSPLIDSCLSEDEESLIKEVINKYNSKIVDFHEFRTRRAGNIKYIDFHMLVDKKLSVEEAHDLSDKIENDIEKAVKNTSVNIHIEPACSP
ncbi:MAG TPA: cation diffusion facilitator family transporter [Clostridia bacterium]